MAKTVPCPDCDQQTVTADTPDEALKMLYGHYMANHEAIIKGANQEKKEAWMKNFYATWEATAEV